jgi:hypothetical protein
VSVAETDVSGVSGTVERRSGIRGRVEFQGGTPPGGRTAAAADRQSVGRDGTLDELWPHARAACARRHVHDDVCAAREAYYLSMATDHPGGFDRCSSADETLDTLIDLQSDVPAP